MKYGRFGKIKLTNHILELCLSICCLIIGIPFYLYLPSIVFFVAGILYILDTFLPYHEKFRMSNNEITTYCFGKETNIILPSKNTLVIGNADIVSYANRKFPYVNQCNPIRGELSISILQDISVEDAIRYLRGNYTNCWVEELMRDYFVYSFVYSQELLAEIISNSKTYVIIPKSLLNKIDISILHGDIYIDNDF